MLKIRIPTQTWKCPRHPHYNPHHERDPRAAVKGACPRCLALADVAEAQMILTAAMDRANRIIRPGPSPKMTSGGATARTAENGEIGRGRNLPLFAPAGAEEEGRPWT